MDTLDIDENIYNITTTKGVSTTEVESVVSTVTDIASYINKYGLTVVWVIGTIGNILSFAVFSREVFKQSLTGFLFRCLAVFDFIVVQEHIEKPFLFGGIDTIGRTTLTCRISYWIIFSVQIIAVWVLVLIAMERLICVIWPHQAKVICTLRRGKILLGILICVSLLLMCQMLLALTSVGYYEPSLNNIQRYCVFRSKSFSLLYYSYYIRPWITLFVYSIVPFIVISKINLTIAISLGLAHNRRQAMQHSAANNTTGSSHDKLSSLTIMLMCISITFLVLSIPNSFHYLIKYFANIRNTELWAVGYVLQALNHSINFGLYCLSGQRFRHEVLKIISCK